MYIPEDEILTEERWQDIPGNWCRRYQISDHGHVRAPDPLIQIVRGRPCPSGPIKSFPDRDGYERVGLRNTAGKKVNFKISRLVADGYVYKNDPSKIEVDHCDSNRSNDLWSNLEWVTPTEQQRRRVSKARAAGKTTSCYVGVTWHAKDHKWCAQIVVNKKRVFIGNYDIECEAAKAYNYFVDANNLQFPLNRL